jgi:hypothetical protein
MAARLAPLVWLAAGDTSGPTDANSFIANSHLYWAHDQDCKSDLITRTVDEDALADGTYRHRRAINTNPVGLGVPVDCPEKDHIGREYRSNENTHPLRSEDVPGKDGFFLDLVDSRRPGLGSDAAPTYWQYNRGEGGRGAYVFWLFYAYNDYHNKHEGDWERIAVQVDRGAPTGVVFWKHELPPCLVPWNKLERTEDGHPIVYSAKNAHGAYPREGKFRHPGGVDEASKGTQWRTWERARDVRTERWFGYGGGWGQMAPIEVFSGPDGPNPLYDKASAALTDALCSVADHFTGNWSSTGPVDPPMSWNSTVQLDLTGGDVGEVVGRVTYPNAGCTGQLQAKESTAGKLVLIQTITRDPGRGCAEKGTVTLTTSGDEVAFSLSYQEIGKEATHTARLRRK